MNCPKCKAVVSDSLKKCPNCGSPIYSSDELATGLAGLLAIAGIGFLLVKGLKLVLQKIDWDSVGKFVVDVLYRLALTKDLTQIHPRLKQAQAIFDTGEKYTAEMAAGLACGALESALTLLLGPWAQENQDGPRGLVEIADTLYNKSKISSFDAETIKRIAAEVRNPTAHGHLINDRMKVQNAITWINEFVSRKITTA